VKHVTEHAFHAVQSFDATRNLAMKLEVPRHRLLVLLIAPCLLLALAAGHASAGPWPSDAAEGPAANLPDVMPTALFGLGEVDLSTLGVSDTDLLTVGPQLGLTASSDSGMLIVDDDMLDCPNAQFTTIQSAVLVAMPGDKIKVCAGTYIEQVTIPAGKDGLTLFAEAAFQAVIKAPILMADPKAIVRVSGAQNVTIRHFTITGPGGLPCDSLRYGVRVDNGGSALITDNHITEIHDTPFSGCQNGHGVNVGRTVDGTSGSAIVVHNRIDNYQKGGVFVDNADSAAEVAYNEVVGVGPMAVIAQNGIQVSRGAHGDVHHNKVSGNVYAPAGTEATGILLYSDPVADVHHNDVFLNEDGIGLFVVTNGAAEVSYNNSRNNTNDGIVVFDIGTTENLIAYNKAFQNAALDCHDESFGTHNGGVANEWLKDLGRTENRSGLCKNAGPQ
jgi:nitrous oxidase accessory protein NosD